jgi:Ca-dependent carbohydrate-binding module xylan-binding
MMMTTSAILLGAVGHRDQGGPYTNVPIIQQASDLHAVFGNGTVLWRGIGESESPSATGSDLVAYQNAGIEPIVEVATYPPFATFSDQSAAYNWAYSNVSAVVTATPTAKYYEIGNEWTINGPTNTWSGDGSLPGDWTTQPYFLRIVGAVAGAVAAIRDNNPSAKIIGGEDAGWTMLGLPVALAQSLVNYNGRNLTWDYTALHWYDDAASGNQMGMPDNFNGGMNAYQLLNGAGKPLFITEFGSSDGNNPANDPQAGSDLTALMNNFLQHQATTATEPGIAGATIYEMYQQPGAQTDYALYDYSGGSSGIIAPQGKAVEDWIAAHPSASGGSSTAAKTASPDGTKITSASASPIIDKSGNAWSLVQSGSNGLQIAVNGTVDPVTANVVLLEITGGKIMQENAAGNWYSITGPGGAWTLTAAPAAPPAPSPDGTKITTAAAIPIIDQAGNAWTLVQSATNGLQIAVNGTVDPITANVVLLETTGGKIEQENAAGTWYTAPGPGGAWTAIAAPVTTGTGSDTLVLGISEDAYLGNAQFTVSVDGKQLAGAFTATALHAAAASQSLTFKGDWAPGTHTVAVNFLNDAYGGSAAADRNLYVNTLSYDGTATGQSAALMSTGAKSFTVTDTTAVPAAAIGSGSDAVVLNVSEDAYLGNAQFTVSVDGKQLGGTFTATASHAAGASQSFTFNGDFGTGSHAVAVNFLNDAYAGTAATDRNLYVNGITYGGTATGQSGALMSTGAKAFTVVGGTTPSVSETGDHGSLTKSLSQTGSYTVGGDTFVLSSGNAAAVTLGTGVSQIKFIGAGSLSLTGGSGSATVTADAGANKFVAGTGALDVTGGGGKDAYVFHANGGVLRIEDFSIAKGDTLTVDKALQGAMQQASDGQGGTMLTFGSGATHGVDIHGMAAMPATNVLWA